MKYILAIDQGTTGSRACLYDKFANKIASSYEEFPQIFPKPGWVEHDPEKIWKSVNNSIQKVFSTVRGTQIAAIGITNQRETTVLWDKITGKPVYNAIVWQCRRTAQRCQELKSDKNNVKLVRNITGLPIDAYFSATKIEWILNNVPGVLKKAKEGRILFGTADTWILYKLTGGASHATDFTNASRTMLFNINKLTWDNVLLRKFKIPTQILPIVKKSSSVFGKTIKIGKLPKGIPICGIAGDQQAALFGQACFSKGDIKNTYGTGSFVLLNTGKKKIISKFGLITTLACGSKGEPVYALEGSAFIAGAAIQWLRDGLKILSNAGLSEKIALSLKDNAGVYFVPALVGLGAPYWQSDARGLICGVTRGTNANHFVRAALEAICYQTKDLLIAMQKDSHLSIKSLKIDGGAAVNNFLCQFQSDILRIKVIRPKIIESTSLGAAYLAGLAVGYWKNTKEIARYWRTDKVFYPKMTDKLSNVFYKGWLKAIERTLAK